MDNSLYTSSRFLEPLHRKRKLFDVIPECQWGPTVSQSIERGLELGRMLNGAVCIRCLQGGTVESTRTDVHCSYEQNGRAVPHATLRRSHGARRKTACHHCARQFVYNSAVLLYKHAINDIGLTAFTNCINIGSVAMFYGWRGRHKIAITHPSVAVSAPRSSSNVTKK